MAFYFFDSLSAISEFKQARQKYTDSFIQSGTGVSGYNLSTIMKNRAKNTEDIIARTRKNISLFILIILIVKL